MKIIITYFTIVVLMISLMGCEFSNSEAENQKITLTGEYKPGKGCNGLVNGVEIKTSCEEYKEYSGKSVEVIGIITESKCAPELPQCFDGQQMEKADSIRIIQ